MDAFAEETGYEGTFTGKQFLIPSITNPSNEVYDHFNPYDETECIIQGSLASKAFHATHSSYNSSPETSESAKNGRFTPVSSS